MPLFRKAELIGAGSPEQPPQVDTTKPIEAVPFEVGATYVYGGRQYQLGEQGWRDIGEWPPVDRTPPVGTGKPEGYQPPPARAPRSGDLRPVGTSVLVFLDETDAAARGVSAGWHERKTVPATGQPAWFEPDPLLHEVR